MDLSVMGKYVIYGLGKPQQKNYNNSDILKQSHDI